MGRRKAHTKHGVEKQDVAVLDVRGELWREVRSLLGLAMVKVVRNDYF